MRSMALRASIAVSDLAGGCSGPRAIVLDGGRQCQLQPGFNYSQVLEACGVPTGFKIQPKVPQGLLGDMCSAPVYRYGSSDVAFDCQGKVARILTDGSTVGVDLGAEFLGEEIQARRHVEAAIVQLARVAPHDPRTQALISEVEALGGPLSAIAASKARAMSGLERPRR